MLPHVDSEDSEQIGRMTRLIRVLAGFTGHFVGFVLWRLKFIKRASIRGDCCNINIIRIELEQ